MRGLGEITRLCAVGRPTSVSSPPSRRRTPRRVGGHRRRRPGQGRARRGAAAGRHGDPQRRRRARARRWPARTPAAVADVRPRPRRRRAHRRPRARRPRPAPRSRCARRGAPSRSQLAVQRRATWRPTPPPRSPSPASLGVDVGAAAAALGASRAVGDADAGRAGRVRRRRRSTTPTTPTRRRWPRRSTRSPRSTPTGASPSLGVMAELDDPVAGAPRDRRPRRRLGIELVAVGTDRYGVAPVDDADVADAVGPIGAGVAVLVKASRAAGLERLVAALASVLTRRVSRTGDGRSGVAMPGARKLARPASAAGRTTRPGTTATTAPRQQHPAGADGVDDRAEDQVAERDRSAEGHEPQRHHDGPLGVGEVLLEDRDQRRRGRGSRRTRARRRPGTPAPTCARGRTRRG